MGRGQRGSPSQGWGTAGGCRDDGGPTDVPAGKGTPSAHVLRASFMGCRDHSMKDSRDRERSLHQGSLKVPGHRERTCIYICIYLFNRNWASSSCALCAGVSDSSLFLCRENDKTSEKGSVAPSIISLDCFLPQAPYTVIIGYFCT